MMERLWRFLNSRKTAVYLLLAMLVLLVLSTMLPSEMTLTDEQWLEMETERPLEFWLATHFSTPYIVRGPIFIAISLFLFFSTLVCTTTRIKRWVRLKRSEFEKEKAFSFSIEEKSMEEPDTLKAAFTSMLIRKRWEFSSSGQGDRLLLEAQKGLRLGFWGSVAFHVGLLVCFLAVPVTALSVFRGEIVLTEGETVSFDQAVDSSEGMAPFTISDLPVSVDDLWGIYYEGEHQVDFGGNMNIDGQEFPFSVNKAVTNRGYQFSLYEFGYSTEIAIEKEGEVVFDYFLNLRHPEVGDYFEIPQEGLDMFVLFFPDFSKEGTILSTRSKEPNNPVLLVKFIKAGRALHKGLLLRPGEEAEFENYKVRFPELRNWVTMIVVKEWGMPLIAVGFIIGIPGLFVRFLSNERRLEFEISGSESGTQVAVRGFSRYYPAFLEREVNKMAAGLRAGGTLGGDN